MKNKSDVAVMLKEAGILFAITLIAGILLGFVHELTEEPIRDQQEKAVQKACMAALSPEMVNGRPDSGEGSSVTEAVTEIEFREYTYAPDEALTKRLADMGVRIGTVYEGVSQAGVLCGYVVESVSSEGYGGDIVLYVGVTADGAVGGVSITKISETAGLGMEAPKVLTPQFAGKWAESFSYTKTGSRADSEVDAISGATVTTKAVVNAVNGGLETARILLRGGGADE